MYRLYKELDYQFSPFISDILKDADLDNLSAKKVRLSLQEQYDTDLTDKYVNTDVVL